jgi:hypothetical protein
MKSCSILEFLTDYCQRKRKVDETNINTDVKDEEIAVDQNTTTDETEYRKESIPGHQALTVEVQLIIRHCCTCIRPKTDICYKDNKN